MAIKINVQKAELEFDFAGLTVMADTSDEALSKMMNLKDSDLKEQAEKEADKLKGIKEGELTAEEFDTMVKVCVDLYGKMYEPVFGDGFEKAYGHIKSINATVAAFEEAIDYMVEDVEEKNKQYDNRRKSKVAKYKKNKKK